MNTRWTVACGIIVTGLAYAAWISWRQEPPTIDNVATSSAAQLVSHDLLDTTPTTSNVERVMRIVRKHTQRRVQEVDQQLNAEQVDDLVEVFAERVRRLIDPDFERDFASMVKRGFTVDRDAALRLHEMHRSEADRTLMSKIGIADIRIAIGEGDDLVRQMKHAGLLVTEGYYKPGASAIVPIMEDRPGSLSATILMPMARQPVQGEGAGVVWIGFRFVWVTERNQWLVTRTFVCAAMGEPHTPILPFL